MLGGRAPPDQDIRRGSRLGHPPTGVKTCWGFNLGARAAVAIGGTYSHVGWASGSRIEASTHVTSTRELRRVGGQFGLVARRPQESPKE